MSHNWSELIDFAAVDVRLLDAEAELPSDLEVLLRDRVGYELADSFARRDAAEGRRLELEHASCGVKVAGEDQADPVRGVGDGVPPGLQLETPARLDQQPRVHDELGRSDGRRGERRGERGSSGVAHFSTASTTSRSWAGEGKRRERK